MAVGVDVARFGTDKPAIAARQGNVVVALKRQALEDTMQTTGWVVAKLTAGSRAVVGAIGVGSGVADRLREQGHKVEAFNASETSSGHDRSGELEFLTRHSEAWWGLRELLDPAYGPTVCLLPEDQMLGDLCAPKWTITSAGKIQIEAKDAIRARLGRSPDAGDAVVQAFATRQSSVGVYLDALREQAEARQGLSPQQAQALMLRDFGFQRPER